MTFVHIHYFNKSVRYIFQKYLIGIVCSTNHTDKSYFICNKVQYSNRILSQVPSSHILQEFYQHKKGFRGCTGARLCLSTRYEFDKENKEPKQRWPDLLTAVLHLRFNVLFVLFFDAKRDLTCFSMVLWHTRIYVKVNETISNTYIVGGIIRICKLQLLKRLFHLYWFIK